MKFDLEDLNPGTWFEIEDARVKVRVCAGKDLEKIYKKTRKRQVEYRRGQRFEWEDCPHPEQETRMINDFIIMDWKNINDANGKPLECNATNKNKLFRESPMFANFIAKCLERLNSDIGIIREEEEKNSLNG